MSAKKASRFSKQELRFFITVFAALVSGAGLCYLLQEYAGCSAILAASALGFLVTFLPLPSFVPARDFQRAFYTGTFVGMSSGEILPSPLAVVVVGALGAVVFAEARHLFSGIGGKMGLLAFCTTALWLLGRSFL